MAFLFGSTKYSTNVTTSNWLATGHDGTDAMVIGGAGKLILSASNGIMHLSGAVDFGLIPDNKAYHIRSVDGPLIFSSSVGSIVALSASQDFTNSDKAYHIRAVNSHLILSSTVGGVVAVSGALVALSGVIYLRGTTGANDTKFRTISNGVIDVVLANDAAATLRCATIQDVAQTANFGADNIAMRSSGKFYIDNSSNAVGSGVREVALTNARATYSAGGALSGTWGLSSSIAGVSMGLTSLKGLLILSSSEGSVVSLSASQDFTETNKGYHVRAVNSHLILSSSAGSVVTLSAALNFATPTNTNYTIASFGEHLILSSSLSAVDFSASINFENTSRAFHVRSTNTHLIFSSTIGSVVKVSGALSVDTVPTANLITGVDTITGSIMWDSTRKTLKIYGPLGWTPILTGTAG